MTEKTLIASMTYLASLFGHKLSPEKIKIYWSIFKGRSDEWLGKAVSRLAMSFKPSAAQPYPLPADFINAMGEDGNQAGIRAMARVRKAVQRYGRYRSVAFGDPALHRVIERYGGWPEICAWCDDDWRMKERAWMEAYKAEAAFVAAGTPNHLPGLAEIENGKLYDGDLVQIPAPKQQSLIESNEMVMLTNSDDLPF